MKLGTGCSKNMFSKSLPTKPWVKRNEREHMCSFLPLGPYPVFWITLAVVYICTGNSGVIMQVFMWSSVDATHLVQFFVVS